MQTNRISIDVGRYEKLLKLSSEPMVVHTPDGEVLTFNKAFARLSNYSHPAICSLNLYHFLVPKNGNADPDQVIGKLQRDEVYEFYGELIKRDGSTEDVYLRAVMDQVDDQDVMITSVKRLAVNESQVSQLSRFPEENPNPVLQINAAKRILYANASSRQLLTKLGVDVGDLLPLNWREYIDDLTSDATDTESFEYIIDGRHFLFKHSHIRESDLIFIHGLDISDIKAANENLEELNFELNNFLYRAHHDLQSPVSTLKGLLELASTYEVKGELTDLLDHMKSTTLKMDGILDDLVKVIELNFMETEVGEINAASLLKAMEEDPEVGPYFSTDSLHVIRGQDNPTTMDKNAAQYILKSLLSNALKFKDDGKPKHEIVLSISTDGNKMDIAVQDNGMGIASAHQPYIFDMFYRGTNSVGGNGMGLYIVNKSLQRINGKIGLSSVEGKGATFYVSAPAMS